MLNDLRNNPAVAGFSTSPRIPTAYDDNFNAYSDPTTNISVNMRQVAIDDGMLPTYRIPMAEGRNFDSRVDKEADKRVIINRAALVQLGWTKAVGRLSYTEKNFTRCIIFFSNFSRH